MSEAQHTPGPWEAEYHDEHEEYWIGHRRTSIGMRVVATVSTGFSEPGESEQHANARLIAAAPDLYTELVAARCTLEAIEAHCRNDAGLRGLDHADEGKRIREALQMMLSAPSAALAKASGR